MLRLGLTLELQASSSQSSHVNQFIARQGVPRMRRIALRPLAAASEPGGRPPRGAGPPTMEQPYLQRDSYATPPPPSSTSGVPPGGGSWGPGAPPPGGDGRGGLSTLTKAFIAGAFILGEPRLPAAACAFSNAPEGPSRNTPQNLPHSHPATVPAIRPSLLHPQHTRARAHTHTHTISPPPSPTYPRIQHTPLRHGGRHLV